MKRTTLLLKSLLLAVGLLAGSNVWAYELPSGYEIKYVYAGTDNGDGTVSVETFESMESLTGWTKDGIKPLNSVALGTVEEVANTTVGGTLEADVVPTYVGGKVMHAYLRQGTATGNCYASFPFTTVSTGKLVFNADFWMSGNTNAPILIKFVDKDGNTVFEMNWNNGSNVRAFNYTNVKEDGTTETKATGNLCTYRTYKGFGIKDFVVDFESGDVNFIIDYIDRNAKRSQTTLSANIGKEKNIASVQVGKAALSSTDLYIDVDNMSLYTVGVESGSYNYTVKATAANGTIELLNDAIATGTCKGGIAYTVTGLSKVIEKDGVFYVLDDENVTNFCATYTMGEADETRNVNYTADPSIIFFKEAETIQQKYEYPQASGGYSCNYYAKPVDVTITESGVYQLETNVTGRDDRSSLEVYTADGTTSVAVIAKNVGLGIKTANFLADGNMRVGGPYYSDNFNNSKSVDYILVRKLYSVSNIDNIVGATDNSTGFMAAHKDVTINKGQVVKFNFKNHGNGSDNWCNWLLRMSGTSGVDHTLRADNYVIGDDGSTVSTRSITEDDSAINWSDFVADMTDADVEMTVTYAADGRFFIEATSTGAAHTYKHSFAYTDNKTGGILLELGVEKAWLEVTDIQYTINIGSTGWATLYTTSALDFTKTGLTAYTATVNLNESTVELTDVTTVPANTGVVLMGDEGSYTIPVIASSETKQGELLGSATESTACPAANGTYYVLAKVTDGVQFNPATTGSIAAGKAYLYVKSGEARALNVVFAGETTAIDAIANVKEQNGEVYNLAGQRVAKPAKGLYIVSGKKVMFK